MKLSIISEVANPKLTSMDGVTVSASGSGTVKYKFVDPNVPDKEYIVEFVVHSKGLLDYNFRDDPVYMHLKNSNPSSESYSLILMAEDTGDEERYSDSFAKTGKGNFGFVYGKLMACVIDFFVTRKYKVLLLYFTGHTRDMELVYKRIMDRLNSEYPAFAMRPYEPETIAEAPHGYYVSLSAIENIEDDNIKQQAYNSIQGIKHAAKIKKIRELKTKDI